MYIDYILDVLRRLRLRTSHAGPAQRSLVCNQPTKSIDFSLVSAEMAEHGVDSAALAAASANLPPGWDCKYDGRTGRFYYINYFTKTTTWEDPRHRYRPVAQPPQFFSSGSGEAIPLQDLTNIRPSPIPSRAYTSTTGTTTQQTLPYSISTTRPPPTSSNASTTGMQESSLSIETEQAVAKIGAMFPTVGETHIRTLLKKYHNREAVVMSALQVEKHPITTPGPYATPSLGRSVASAPIGLYSAYQQIMAASPARRCSPPRSPTPRPGSGASSSGSYGSPHAGETFRSSPPRPHSSPKMKLRYMKSVFPAVEETLLLDILVNAENNVQKATEKLVTMGFEKRDTPPPRLTQRRKEEEQKALEKQRIAASTPTPPPRMKSLEEKQKMKIRLQDQYPEIPEHVVTIALDSSDFDEERAALILQVMVQEETTKPSSGDASTSSSKEGMNQEVKSQPLVACEAGLPHGTSPHKGSPARKQGEKTEKTPQHRRSKGKKEVPKVSRGTSTTEDKEYKSPYLQRVNGPNAELHTGPNDELLLVDYVTWNGPNCELRMGSRKSLAKGPNLSLREERICIAKGPNKDLYHGPVKGLAKGSIYAQLTLCNSESRGN
jgi:hypothetical protein